MHVFRKWIFVLLFAVSTCVSNAQGNSDSHSEGNQTVTTLDEFRAEREAGDLTQNSEERLQHWRTALKWQSKHPERLELATKMAAELRRSDPPYIKAVGLYREIVTNYNQMDYYSRYGATSPWEASLAVPYATYCLGYLSPDIDVLQ